MGKNKSKWIVTKNYITYRLNEYRFKKDYDIEKSRLNDLCNYNDYSNASEWVVHLSGKVWANKKMLLELCELIKEYYPTSTINWKETNKCIERFIEE